MKMMLTGSPTLRKSVEQLTITACLVSADTVLAHCWDWCRSIQKCNAHPVCDSVVGWSPTYEFGVAVQTWGDTPPCTPPTCRDRKSGKAACCTADCQVLGTGAPSWSLLDAANPSTGGVQATYMGAPVNKSNPFTCHFNPAVGSHYRRQVHFQFRCEPSVKRSVALRAVANETDCSFTLVFLTNEACASPGASPGRVTSSP